MTCHQYAVLCAHRATVEQKSWVAKGSSRACRVLRTGTADKNLLKHTNPPHRRRSVTTKCRKCRMFAEISRAGELRGKFAGKLAKETFPASDDLRCLCDLGSLRCLPSLLSSFNPKDNSPCCRVRTITDLYAAATQTRGHAKHRCYATLSELKLR